MAWKSGRGIAPDFSECVADDESVGIAANAPRKIRMNGGEMMVEPLADGPNANYELTLPIS